MPELEEFEKLAHLKDGKHFEVARAKRSIEQLEYTAVNAITTALGFVIALTWVDTIKLSFNEFLASAGITGTGLYYNIFVALLITLFCVIGIVYLPKIVIRRHIEEAEEAVKKKK